VAVRRVVVAEHREVALDRHAGCLRLAQDHALLLVGRAVGIGLAHHDHDLAARIEDSRRPPLQAVDHVVVAVAADLGADVGGVRRRHLGLGHRERRADLPVEQRLEPALLLLGVPVARDHLHVPGVGRGAVEHLGREPDAAHHLAQRRVLEVGEAGAVTALGQEEVPEPGRARLALQLLDDRRDLPAIGAERAHLLVVGLLVGVDVLVHEARELLERELGLVAVGEIHGGPPARHRRAFLR
jgi:hypothetical protein